MMDESKKKCLLAFKKALLDVIPKGQVIDDLLYRFAYGTDASFYRLIPEMVVRADTLDEVRLVLEKAKKNKVGITFRAAGTSLSGQSVTDSVLLVLGEYWQDISVEDDGDMISLQPGVIGARANDVLRPYGRRIGPDPASINTAKIGGIAANNASGMCCGTANNSYNTLNSMKVVLADGALLDTGNKLSLDMFRNSHSDLLLALRSLAEEVKANENLSALIRKKYRLKNTTGYSLNALLDFNDPIDILQHLMIGSEGTLGFIAEVSLTTVKEEHFKAAGLFFFDSIKSACNVVSALSVHPVSAVELIDRKGLKAVEHMEGLPADIKRYPDNTTALLIEICGDDEIILEQRLARISKCIEKVSGSEGKQALLNNCRFTRKADEMERLWSVRKGLFPAVGAVRTSGTTVIIEDVAFPVDRLASGVIALHALLDKYAYTEAVIFGHALEGNLHFVFTQSFEEAHEVERYAAFMEELARLVAVDYQGSLKAEHGTGRNMAPFVELEWGKDAYEVMWKIKKILDPENILNPGVLLNHDERLHLKNLKPLPATDSLVDKCMECGFCEPSCPSRKLTLSPRQRISSWREISRLRKVQLLSEEEKRLLRDLQISYEYAGTDTCAACGLCELRCPVDINTADLTLSQRSLNNQKWSGLAKILAKHYGIMMKIMRLLMFFIGHISSIFNKAFVSRVAAFLHRISKGYIPLWPASLASTSLRVGVKRTEISKEAGRVIYFPACPGRLFDQELSGVAIELLERAGFDPIIPDKLDSLCCGMPFRSKGFIEVARKKAVQIYQSIAKPGEPGSNRLPLIVDAAPCSQQLSRFPSSQYQTIDLVDFLHDFVLPRLRLKKLSEPIAVHVTCSSQHSSTGKKLIALAEACSDQVILPAGISCCGFAGDKGFTLPTLNASALSGIEKEIPAACTRGFSNSRSCEIGLSEHTGIPYRHVAFLLLAASEVSDKQVSVVHE